MMTSVAHLRGSVAGAAIMTFFGSAWCLLALIFWHARPVWAIPAGCVAAVVLFALCAWRLFALRKFHSVDDPVAAAKGKRAGIWFGIIFGAEGMLIGLCCGLLAHFGLTDWIPVAVAAIVGLHFLPLARVFEVPLYYWTGAMIVVAMAACCLIGNAELRALTAGLVMAALLWLTAVVLLVRTSKATAGLVG